tara:strand:- start:1956 stop:2210 length:255 start_codon:yes stop_codon:yes gene_type:complete
MKSKNIPEDIRTKSIKEAQKEIKEIIAELENSDSNRNDPEYFKEQYMRVFQLDHHIQQGFRKKAQQINQLELGKNKKKSSKNSK